MARTARAADRAPEPLLYPIARIARHHPQTAPVRTLNLAWTGPMWCALGAWNARLFDSAAHLTGLVRVVDVTAVR